MATFPLAFRSLSERVHCDHEMLINELEGLDCALDDLAGCVESFAYRAATELVSQSAQRLSQALPDHFLREESSLLETVAKVSPELAEFAREMRAQHQDLRGRLGEFCHAVQHLQTPGDRFQTVSGVTGPGKALVSELRAHIILEEIELGGFL